MLEVPSKKANSTTANHSIQITPHTSVSPSQVISYNLTGIPGIVYKIILYHTHIYEGYHTKGIHILVV